MKGKISSKLKKALAGVLAAVTTVAMLIPAGVTTFAAGTDMTCHSGETYFLTLQDAVDSVLPGSTIVIDSADAGPAVVDNAVVVDAGGSGYDLDDVVSIDETEICVEEYGTIKSFAFHDWPAEEGGVIFNWDLSTVPATATVMILDGNYHDITPEDNEAFVVMEPEDAETDCGINVDVEYTARFTFQGMLFTETKAITIPAAGHKYALEFDGEDQDTWWDGRSYTEDGIPMLKNVNVVCERCGDRKEASVELVEEVPGTPAPTCTTDGQIIYYFQVMYNGAQIKTSFDEDKGYEGLLKIVDNSAPATGIHIPNTAAAPKLEVKTYAMDAEGNFIDQKGNPVEDIADAAVEWTEYQTAAAENIKETFLADGVLTYRLAWECIECGEYAAVDESQFSAGTPEYYLDDAKTKTTKFAECAKVTVTNFDPVPYTLQFTNAQGAAEVQVREIAINPIEIVTDEPLHGPLDNTKADYTKIDPTCYMPGSEEGICTLCGERVTKVLPRTSNHTFDTKKGEVTVDPTCTEMGYSYKVCTKCAEYDAPAVDLNGKVVPGLEEIKDASGNVVKGAIITATTKPLDHNFILRNANDVLEWDTSSPKVDVTCDVRLFCTRCNIEPIVVTYHSAKGTDDLTNKYSAISTSTTRGADCTKFDVITYTVDDLYDLNSGRAVTEDVETTVRGPHSYKVKAVHFSIDGKSANVTLECGTKGCPEKTRTIAATSTASDVDLNTGLTTYTASITEDNLKAAGLGLDEVDRTIPASMATKQFYDLTNAVVIINNDHPRYPEFNFGEEQAFYYDFEYYFDRENDDVTVMIGNAVIDPRFYHIEWPAFRAPLLDAEVTVSATSYELNGIKADGTSPATTFDILNVAYDADEVPDDTILITLDGEEIEEGDDFEFTYDGTVHTYVVTTEAEGAIVSYNVDGEAADAVELKDVSYDEEFDVVPYEIIYGIRYPDGTVLISWAGETEVLIEPADVVIIQTTYTKEQGAEDPEIVIDTTNIAEGDELGLTFDKHSEAVGTYNVRYVWVNTNYIVRTNEFNPNTDNNLRYVTLTITEGAEPAPEPEPEPEPEPTPEFTGWVYDGGHWYYFIEDEMVTNDWVCDSDGTWYYMLADGAMAQGGWLKVGDLWYYLKGNGAMAINEWIDGYWLGASGAWTYNAYGTWRQNATGWWYGDTKGWYAKNETIRIDHKLYTFSAAGYWIPLG